MKRTIDLCVSVLLAIVLSPALLTIACAVRFKLGSPVLFRQTRIGLGGAPFTLVKFRTMTGYRSSNVSPAEDAHRLTPFGKRLRGTSLDELPELWNIVCGEMSLVGPRPLLPEYLPLYDDEQRRRHEVRPGITGWAQVNGRNAVSWGERFKLDVWYVDNRSFALDLKIILRTIMIVLRREGISEDGQATMTPFRGNK